MCETAMTTYPMYLPTSFEFHAIFVSNFKYSTSALPYSQKRTARRRASPTSLERTMGVTSSTDSDVACVVSQSSATSSSSRFPAMVRTGECEVGFAKSVCYHFNRTSLFCFGRLSRGFPCIVRFDPPGISLPLPLFSPGEMEIETRMSSMHSENWSSACACPLARKCEDM